MQNKNVYQIKKTDLIKDISNNSSKALELLAEYGLFCVSCPLNQFDSLETGAMIHGMSNEEVDKMIKEINSYLEKEAKENSKITKVINKTL